MTKILFIGGGSIGHLAPCIAVWRAIAEGPSRPSIARDCHALFLCSERDEEAEFLKHENLAFEQIPLPPRSLLFPLQFFRAHRKTRELMKRFPPDVVFSKGGSLSIAPCLTAKKRGIPIVLHESDAVMGRANSLLSKWASVVCAGFPAQNTGDSFNLVPGAFQFTGNPIRPDLTRGSRDEGLRIAGFTGERPILLILGGSQGAQAINEFVWGKLQEILELCDVIHITGNGKIPPKNYQRRTNGYFWSEFAHAELPHFYGCADIAVSRGGAGSLSELASNGIATIIIPLEGLAQNHQVENAKQAAMSGGAIHVPQQLMSRELVSRIRSLVEDPLARKRTAEKFRSFARPEAARNIAEILLGFDEAIASFPSSKNVF